MGGTSYATFTTGGGGGGGGGSTTPFQQSPSGALNSSNKTFTLSHTPSSNASVAFYIDGIIQYQGIGLDYTISGAIITTAIAPTAAQTVWAKYEY